MKRFDYQSDRHCSKTCISAIGCCSTFDYQSDRHCSKTGDIRNAAKKRLITSQIDTAPKLGDVMRIYESGDYSYIDEVLVMDESGDITRLKR